MLYKISLIGFDVWKIAPISGNILEQTCINNLLLLNSSIKFFFNEVWFSDISIKSMMCVKGSLCNLNASIGNQPPVISMDKLLKITWRRNNFKDVCQQFFFFLRICGYKVCYIIIIGSDREFKNVSKLLNANYVHHLSTFKHNSNTWINFFRFRSRNIIMLVQNILTVPIAIKIF